MRTRSSSGPASAPAAGPRASRATTAGGSWSRRVEPLRPPVDEQVRRDLPHEGARLDAAAALAREPEEAAHAWVLADDGHAVGRERPESRPPPAKRVRHERRGEPGEPL